jgi:hypothetical protein
MLLFATEVLIALYMNDRIVRPYVGDYMVVMLLYCFIRSFTKLPVAGVALSVLVFSYMLEGFQHFAIVDRLGLENINIARVMIGTSFAWLDLLAYTLGIITVLLIERKKIRT